MTPESQGPCCWVSSANIAHGVCPPLTAKRKTPSAATASRASSATNSAPAAAPAAGAGSVWSSCSMPGLLLPLGVAAELAAHRGEDLAGELTQAPRLESLVERRGDDRGGNPLVYGGVHRPPALTGVRDPAGEGMQVRCARERLGGQVDQPRRDHRPAPPHLRHLGDVDVVLVRPGIAQRGG